MFGWTGRALTVSLRTGQIEAWAPGDELLGSYLGGRGLGVRLVADRLPAGVDPLGPANVLVFATGPLTSTAAPTAGRFSVAAKSPLTNTIFDANSGGFFGPAFKGCNLDALVLEDAAAEPVYLYLAPERAELRPAGDLWGLDVHRTTDLLRERHGKQIKVACIGPAGERLVRFAAVMNDYHRAAARGGLGAVMGAKRLKAIVADGKARADLSDKPAYTFVLREMQRLLAQNPVTSKGLPEYGTAGLLNIINYFGLLATKNFQQGTFAGAEAVSGEALSDRLLVKKKPCFACPIACGRETKVGEREGEGPEFETIYAFGPMCMVDDLEQITLAGYACNELGLDTISTGVTIACALELRERGLLDWDLRWGQGERLPELVRRIAYREGLGDELAEGALRLATRYGAPDVAMVAKGLELPAYDPRGAQGMGLAYATSNRGGCHMRAYMIGLEVLGLPKRIDRFSPYGKAALCAVQQNLNAAMDSLVVCRFIEAANNETHYARLLSAATGQPFRPEDLMRCGERIWNLERLFNLREGFTRADDTLPRRLLDEPLAEGHSAGHVVELDAMLDEYYRVRAWTPDGIPRPDKLTQLGLSEWAGAAEATVAV